MYRFMFGLRFLYFLGCQKPKTARQLNKNIGVALVGALRPQARFGGLPGRGPVAPALSSIMSHSFSLFIELCRSCLSFSLNCVTLKPHQPMEAAMFYRKAYDKLKSWKAQPNRKALCIQGARQIGKTTVVRAFGKAEYAEPNDLPKIQVIFDSIPAQLNDKNRRFLVNSLRPTA